MKISRSNKIVDGAVTGEVFRIVLLTDTSGNVEILDGSISDWREYVDCATLNVKEYEIDCPPNKG